MGKTIFSSNRTTKNALLNELTTSTHSGTLLSFNPFRKEGNFDANFAVRGLIPKRFAYFGIGPNCSQKKAPNFLPFFPPSNFFGGQAGGAQWATLLVVRAVDYAVIPLTALS